MDIADYLKRIEERNKINADNRFNLRGQYHFDFKNFCNIVSVHAQDIIYSRNESTVFVVDDDNKKLFEYLFLWFTADKSFPGDLLKGIIVSGTKGTGKTCIVKGALMAYSEILGDVNKKHIFEFISCPRFHLKYVDNADGFYFKRNLYMDDLGRETTEFMHFGTTHTPILTTLYNRYDFGALTFATSNFNLKDLSELYSGTVDDRFLSMFNYFELTGKTRRKNIN